MLRRCVETLNPFKAARTISVLRQHARKAASESGISIFRIALEQFALYLSTNLNRNEYYMYRLYDPNLTWEEKKSFIECRNENDYLELFCPRRYRILFRNKLIFKNLCIAARLPVAELYAVFEPTWGRTANGKTFRVMEDIQLWMNEKPVPSVAIKPIAGTQGRMLLLLQRENDCFVSPDRQRYDAKNIFEYVTDNARLKSTYPNQTAVPQALLFEERLRLHPELRMLGRETLCTIRFLTLGGISHDREILGTTLKLPGRDIGVDNLMQGGMAIAVDTETGAIKEGIFDGDLSGTMHRVHPFTGVEFYGIKLPYWEEAKRLALDAARAFPWAHAIEWDIAIIEGNENWAEEFTQLTTHHELFQGRFKEASLKLTAERKRK